MEKKGSDDPLNVLNGSSQVSLFIHIANSEHTSKAESMIFFGFRKGTFNCLFSPAINLFAHGCFGKRICCIQIILPYMPFHHPSGHTLAKTFMPSWALFACFAIAKVLPITLAGCCFPVQTLLFRADITIGVRIISETVFAVGVCFVSMSSVPYNPLNPTLFQMSCYPGIMISCSFPSRF